jgi:hypothetical protein
VPPAGFVSCMGPGIELARLVWQAGEHDAVLQFLQKCTVYGEDTTVTRWIQEIEADGEPSFAREPCLSLPAAEGCDEGARDE